MPKFEKKADQIWKMLMKTANQIGQNLFILFDFKVIEEWYAEFFEIFFFSILWLSEIWKFIQNSKKHKNFDFNMAP